MTAIGFNIARPAATHGSRTPQRRGASAPVAVAAVSHGEFFKRVCNGEDRNLDTSSIIDAIALVAGSRRRSNLTSPTGRDFFDFRGV